MRSTSLISRIVICSLFATGAAFADTPASKWYDSIGISGYLQGSYVANLNNPTPQTNVGRQFDTDSNSFNLNTFLLQIAKPVGEDKYGFTARLRTGKDANALNLATGGAGGNSTGVIAVQEAYVTYAPMAKLSLIGGKFVTPEGFEGIDTVNNPNFSEGLLFTFAEPLTHTGIKANYVFSDMVNATLGVVNAWDLTTDNNTAKTLLWQVATTPMKQVTWSFQGLYGKELADPTHSKRLSLDTVVGMALTDKLSINLQGNWGQQSDDPNSTGGQGTSHWVGGGIWASLATTSMFTETIRFEVLSDENGAARFYGGTAPLVLPFNAGTSTNQTVKEVTLTHKTMLTSALGTRLEYRHDWSNQPYFVRDDGSAVTNQNTVSADFFVLF